MAHGPLFGNGNVFAWYGIKEKVVGNVGIQATPGELQNSRKSAEFQLEFPERSASNFVRLYNAFTEDYTEVSSCFWAKIYSTPCGIIAYSTTLHDEEMLGYMQSGGVLDWYVHGSRTSGPVVESYTDWHFYCIQWRSSDGLVEIYQDGNKFPDENVGKGDVVRAGGAMIIGHDPDGYASGFQSHQSLSGKITQLNFWKKFLTIAEIRGMAAGVMNINGDILQWRDLRDHVYGSITVEDGAEPRIPDYPLQKKRDAWCDTKYLGTYARFIRNEQGGYLWRCTRPITMLEENFIYNTAVNSDLYYSKSSSLLAIQN